MELIQQCYHDLFWGALVLLGLGLLAVMVYIIRARLTVDRIIGINLIGTLVAIIIAILAYLLGEDYLVDGALPLDYAHEEAVSVTGTDPRRDDAVPHLHQPVPVQAAGREGGRIA